MDVASRFRCVMFTPALDVERFQKALLSEADIALIDLEDSIGWQDKEKARLMALQCLALARPKDKAVAVRVNAIVDSCGIKDLNTLSTAERPPDFILLPKAEQPLDIMFVQNYLLSLGMNVGLIALIETAKGLESANSIASAHCNVKALLFGSADYTRDIGAEICWDTLLLPRSRIIHAARLAGIKAIDTPFFDIHDLEGLKEDSNKVSQLGFDGRCAIHPKQIKPIQNCFSPSYEAIARAKNIVIAAKANNGNVCQVNGEMVGQPIIYAAQRLLQREGYDLEALDQVGNVKQGVEHV